MSDELPAAAIEAGVEAMAALCIEMDDPIADIPRPWLACAVLLAATERIDCPDYRHGDTTGLVGISPPESCALCAGTGFLYVLKQSESE